MPVARRTQAERSASTQARLLDAALNCLVEHGYGGTTTTGVAERAGVSRGAQLHHYPTRAALVAAAVEHLFAGLTDQYQRAFAAMPPQADRLRDAIELLWSMYSAPHFPAVIELDTAARTTPELRAHLAPIAERHQINVHRLAREYFPDAAALGERFDAVLALVLDTLRGMASTPSPRPASEVAARLDFLHAVAEAALAPTEPR